LLSTANIYCNLKQPWLSSTTTNEYRPSIILTLPGHEIGLVCYNTIQTISAILQYRGRHMHSLLHYWKIAKLAKLPILVLLFHLMSTSFRWWAFQH